MLINNKLIVGLAGICLPKYGKYDHYLTSIEKEAYLKSALELGYQKFDAAQIYGDSHSLLFNIKEKFSFDTKLDNDSRQSPLEQANRAADWKLMFGQKLETVYLHNCDKQNLNEHWLDEFFNQIEKRNVSINIGLSIYDTENIKDLLNKYPIRTLQVNANIFDISNIIELKNLRSCYTINVRSIFLRGVLDNELLQQKYLSSKMFSDLEKSKTQSINLFTNSWSETSLRYFLGYDNVSAVIIGTRDINKLKIYRNLAGLGKDAFCMLKNDKKLSFSNPRLSKN